jgi:hypothetical protein
MVRTFSCVVTLVAANVAAASCPIVERGSPTDGVTTITVVERPTLVVDDALFAGWHRARVTSAANGNGISYEIELRWNRPGVESAATFTWMKGGPGTRSVRETTANGAKLQDLLDREDAVRTVEITFLGEGLETPPVNGFPNLSAVFADVWEWLVAEGIAEGFSGHVGSSSSSLLAANALAYHGLHRVLDGVVLGGGPFWTDLRQSCMDVDSPIFAGGRIRAKIDAWNWDGATPCTDRIASPQPSYECRSLLGPDARARYPAATVSVIVGERRKTFDRTDAGHSVLSTSASAEVVLRRIREMLGPASLPTASAEAVRPAAAFLEALPNPARGSPRIRFASRTPGPARLSIHDVRGALVEELVAGEISAGLHELTWHGPDAAGTLSPGIYFFRWETADGVITRKLTLLR